MKEFNLKYTHKSKRDLYQRAVKYYNSNDTTIGKCSEMFGVDRHNLSRWIKRLSGNYETITRKQSINSSIFHTIDTEEKAYWLGFMYADGCVYGDSYISLELAIKDKEHLVKFNSFLGKCKPIREDNTRVRCVFKDTQIYQDLNNLGIVPRKSLVLKYPSYSQVPKHLMRHFMRGYVDGDGSIYITHNNINISVLGTKEFLYSFIEETGLPKRKLYESKKGRNVNCFFFQYSGANAKLLIDYLYKDATIFLERKYNKYIEYEQQK